MSFWSDLWDSAVDAVKFVVNPFWAATAWVTDQAFQALAEWMVPDMPQGHDPTREAMLQGGVHKLPVVYGTETVGAHIIYAGTWDADGDHDHNDVLTVVAAFCEGPVAAIEEVFFDDVSEHDDRFVTGSIDWLRVDRYLGSSNQAASSVLVDLAARFPATMPEWTVQHVLNNVCYCVIQMEYASTPGAGEDAQPFTHLPQIKARIKGRVFERVTPTGFGGGEVYSANPADCLAEYLTNERYGMGLPATALDFVDFSSAQSACATQVEHYAGSGYHSMFTCNGVLKTDQPVKGNAQTLLQCMRGNLIDSDGKLALRLEGASAPQFDFNDDNIIGGVTVSEAGPNDKFNRVVIKFVNALNGWTDDEVVYPASDAEYQVLLAEDSGIPNTKEVAAKLVNNPYEATEMARVLLLRSRLGLGCTLKAASESLEVEPGDVVSVTNDRLAWVAKTFRVTEKTAHADGTCSFTLADYDDSLYLWQLGTQRSYPGVIIPDSWRNRPDRPLSLTVTQAVNTPTTEAGSLTTLTALVVPPISGPDYRHAVVEYRAQGEDAWQDVPGGANPSLSWVVTNAQQVLEVRAYSVSVSGQRSVEPITATIQLAAFEGYIQVPNVTGLEIKGQGHNTEFAGKDAVVAWRKTSHNDWHALNQGTANDGALDKYFDTYVVKVYSANGALLRTVETQDNGFVYNHEMNLEDGAGRAFLFEVVMRSVHNRYSARPAKLSVSNPAPGVVENVQLSASFHVAQVAFDMPNDLDLAGVKTYLSKTSGFVPSNATLVYSGLSSSMALNALDQNTRYYVRFVAYDVFGDGAVSNEYTVITKQLNTTDLDGLGDWATIDQADRAFIEAHLNNDAIPSEKIESLVASKIAAGTIAATVAIGSEGIIQTDNDGYKVIMGAVDSGGANPYVFHMTDGANVYFSLDSSGALYAKGRLEATELILSDGSVYNKAELKGDQGEPGQDGILPAPAGSPGLYANDNYLGFHNGSTWQSYIGADGRLYLTGSGSAYFDWNPVLNSLTLQGASIVSSSIKTSVSGERIEINDTDNRLRFYSAANALVAQLGFDSSDGHNTVLTIDPPSGNRGVLISTASAQAMNVASVISGASASFYNFNGNYGSSALEGSNTNGEGWGVLARGPNGGIGLGVAQGGIFMQPGTRNVNNPRSSFNTELIGAMARMLFKHGSGSSDWGIVPSVAIEGSYPFRYHDKTSGWVVIVGQRLSIGANALVTESYGVNLSEVWGGFVTEYGTTTGTGLSAFKCFPNLNGLDIRHHADGHSRDGHCHWLVIGRITPG